MFESLDEIDWAELRDADGNSVAEVPDCLRALGSPIVAEWAPAMETLGGLLEYPGLSHASALAVPFLIEAAADPRVACRGQILHLLAHMVMNGWRPDPAATANLSVEEDAERAKAAVLTLRAIARGMNHYIDLVADEDARVSVVAPYLLAHLVGDSERFYPGSPDTRQTLMPVVEAMKVRLASGRSSRTDPWVKASLFLSIGYLAARKPAEFAFPRDYHDPVPSVVSRVGWAMAMLWADAAQASDEAIRVLCDVVSHPEDNERLFVPELPLAQWRASRLGAAYREFGFDPAEGIDSPEEASLVFPWASNACFACVDALCRLPHTWAPRLAEPFAQAVRSIDVNDTSAREVVGPILRYLFAPVRVPPGTKVQRLTEPQRHVLKAFVGNPAMWTTNSGSLYLILSQLGLPQTRETCRSQWDQLLQGER